MCPSHLVSVQDLVIVLAEEEKFWGPQHDADLTDQIPTRKLSGMNWQMGPGLHLRDP